MSTKPSDADVLLPCPFCGSDNISTYMIRDGRRAGCSQCGASGGSHHHGPSTMPSANERAIAAWNTRAALSTPQPTSDADVEQGYCSKHFNPYCQDCRAALSTKNPCDGIFDHKWLSPSCVADGCRSLNTRSLLERVEAMPLPDDPHTNSWISGFCRARKMAADMVRATLDPAIQSGEINP